MSFGLPMRSYDGLLVSHPFDEFNNDALSFKTPEFESTILWICFLLENRDPGPYCVSVHSEIVQTLVRSMLCLCASF